MFYHKTVLQTTPSNTGFTQRPHRAHAAHIQRAHGALEDPTALLERPHSALCKRQAAAFSLCMFKIIAAALRIRRWHSARIALLVTAHRAPRRTVFLGRCRNAVSMTLWCDRGFTNSIINVNGSTDIVCVGFKAFNLIMYLSFKLELVKTFTSYTDTNVKYSDMQDLKQCEVLIFINFFIFYKKSNVKQADLTLCLNVWDDLLVQ